MRLRLVLSVICMTLISTGCSSDSPMPTQSADREAAAGRPNLDNGGGSVVNRVTGSGHVDISSADDRAIRHFTISARKHADGTVSGSYRLKIGPSDLTLAGTVTCLTVVGSTAFVGGTVDANPFPFPLFGVAIELIDNGTASADPDNATDDDVDPPAGVRDRVSPIGIFVTPGDDQAADYCANPIPGPTMAVDFGNLTIR
jgi:hypothetical protein